MTDFEKNYGVFYEKKEYAGFLKRVAIVVVDLFVIVLLDVSGGKGEQHRAEEGEI